MQLFIILALLLYGGKGDARQLLEEVKPVLAEIGGEEMAGALKSAEEISAVLSAVRDFTAASAPQPPREQPESPKAASAPKKSGVAFPLAPINDIADRDIAYSLSKYISENA